MIMNNVSEVIKPNRLNEGDTIALIAPASPQNDDEGIALAIETIESMGFKVKQAAHLYERWGYLAGGDLERAEDLNSAFADETVNGIITLGGGYGSARLLPYLDYEMITRNPKVLMGYSDITALLNAIYARSGVMTFHGPIAAQSYTSYTYSEFRKVIMDPQDRIGIGAPPHFEKGPGSIDRKNHLSRIGSGKVTGRLIGGNLSLMGTLTGSTFLPDYTDKILVLEDVGEATYRLDRYLTQLWLTGSLEKVAAIAFGKFTNCNTSASWAKQLTIEEIITYRCQQLGIPAVRGLMIGHIEDQTTVPIGCLAELDIDACTLTLLEPAVI